MMTCRSLSEMSYEELEKEWLGGQYLDCQQGLSDVQHARLIEIEREMDRRPQPASPDL